MIELNLRRNSEGAYILDSDIISQKYQVLHNINEVSGVELKNNYWLVNDKEKILVKTLDFYPDSYVMYTFAELLFSKFAEKNGVPCCQIDLGYNNGLYYTLSKNVVGNAERKLSLRELRKMCGKEDDYKYATLKEIDELFSIAVNKFGLKIAPGCKYKLKILEIMDFLTVQRDRNITNILFSIKEREDGCVLDVKPFIDNEDCFLFPLLSARYDMGKIPQTSFLVKTKKPVKKVRKLISYAKKEGQLFALPIFGVCSCPKFDYDDLGIKDFFKEIFCRTESKKYKQKVREEVADEIIKDSRLFTFFKSVSFDAEEYGKEIYNETGIKIPDIYLNLAQEIVDYRRNELALVIDEKTQSEMGK